MDASIPRPTHGTMSWPADVEQTPEFAAAIRHAGEARRNLFITGRAGTGKSTLLRVLRANAGARTAVLAPTGLAAVSVAGQTIHSFFGFPPQLIQPATIKRSRRAGLLRNLDTLVIDEVSMVRTDLMHGMDVALRLNREQPRVPFGGVQIIAIGDLHQLPPIIRERELRPYFAETYGGSYFFHAPVFREQTFGLVELTRIFRQREADFVAALNAVRDGRPDSRQLAVLNARVCPLHRLKRREDYVVLTPTQQAAMTTNAQFLGLLRGAEHRFDAEVTGEFAASAYPTDAALVLKEGAKVILLRNDADRRWVNGTQAVVSRIAGGTVWIAADGGEHELEPASWDTIRYEYDEAKGRIVEKVIGSFKQLPIRLAWALTIHKSQGMTLDRVYIDLGRGTFAHGQAYVALSRCRSLDGLALARPISPRDVIFDRAALGYRSLFTALGAASS